MASAHLNFAYSLVATAPSPATTGTSLIVTAADGVKFPAVPFNVTIWITGAQPLTTNAEVVTVTAVSTDTFTIVRAQEGSVARTVVIGDQIAATITSGTLQDTEGPLTPTTDKLVQASYSEYRPDRYEIASGKYLEIGLAGIFEIG